MFKIELVIILNPAGIIVHAEIVSKYPLVASLNNNIPNGCPKPKNKGTKQKQVKRVIVMANLILLLNSS